MLTAKQNAIQERALRTLKQKRMYEAQLAQLTQQTFNMESAALATENLRNTMATVDAMQQANKELRKQYGKIDIDKIEVRFVSSRLVSFHLSCPSRGKVIWSGRVLYIHDALPPYNFPFTSAMRSASSLPVPCPPSIC